MDANIAFSYSLGTVRPGTGRISKSGKSWPSLGMSTKCGISFQMRLQAVQMS